MSELIDNVSQREQRLKDLIQRLHQGEDRNQIEMEFKRDFSSITGSEIAAMERRLVEEGVTIEEIQNFCDIHASLFQGSVTQLHSDILLINPVKEFEEENNLFFTCIKEAKKVVANKSMSSEELHQYIQEFRSHFNEIEKHYARKENILFPYLEKMGIETIPKVMWGVDNKIRETIRLVYSLQADNQDIKKVRKSFTKALDMADDMIVKENKILFPMLLEKLSQAQLKEISVIINQADTTNVEEQYEDVDSIELSDNLTMSLGRLNLEEINAIFNTVPFDMTFVDASDRVKFVSSGAERIFDRPPSVLNRPVHLCHPPQSVDIVMDIIADLRSGKKDHEDFWINFRGKMVHIRYYAIRNAQREYLGVLEVTQNITEIQQLKGEKRLAS